jgi:8-oxo-dGTP diphosphatase
MENKMLLAADAIVLNNGKVILIKRKYPPFQNMWALPGGLVEYNEKVEDAAVREAKEETNLNVSIEKLIGVYSKPGRDPRGHLISVCYLCRKISGNFKITEETLDIKEFSPAQIKELDLAADHKQMIRDAGLIND